MHKQLSLAGSLVHLSPAAKHEVRSLLLGAILIFSWAGGLSATTVQNPPGTYTASWLGNSFGGGGTQWVQDSADKITVAPDGSLFAGTTYDESGRCIGLYKNGAVNSTLLKQTGTYTAWGWGTASVGLGVDGNYIYDANYGSTPPQLVIFHWTPGSINTTSNVGVVALSSQPTGLSASGNILAVVYPTTIEVRNTYNVNTSLSVNFSFTAGTTSEPASDVAIASDSSFWVLAGKVVTHYTSTGTSTGVTVPGLTDPVSVAFDNSGRLMICDNGSYQVKFFTISGGTPTLATSFGTANGLLSGTKGALASGKLYNLVGAGTDSGGNIYVGMSFNNELNQPAETPNASGNCYLASYTSTGTLNWSLFSGSFVDTFGFDPNSNGDTVYSRTGIYSMNYANSTPGTEQSLTDITLDTKDYPNDPRGTIAMSTQVVYPTGGPSTPTLYGIGMQAGGYDIYGFETSGSKIASPLLSVGSSGWAWNVDANGGIWNGDASGNVIDYFPILGWSSNVPQYSTSAPTVFAWPSGWSTICRIKYIASSDTLYLSGYLTGQTAPTWGTIGYTMRCYTGWLHGAQTLAWTNSSLPVDQNGYPPKAMDVAGSYIFMPSIYPYYTHGPEVVHILNASTGAYVGAFQPTSALGVLGEVDTSNGINAVERSNGEYEIMVEEDALAKQILYRWSPNGVTNGTYTLTPGCATGLRLDVAASGTASGTNVDIYTASGGNNQAWTMTNVGGNIYKLNPVNAPGLALNVVGGVNANGTNVDVETDNGSTSQRWILVPVSTGGYTLSPVCATNRSLDVYGAHNTNSSNVDIWGTNGNSSQNWTITPN